MGCLKRFGLALAGLLLLLTFPTGRVFAHANLVRSNPAAGQVLKTAPEQAEFAFSEAVDTRFAQFLILDAQGKVIDRATAQVDPADPRLVRVKVPPLKDGVYSFGWSVRSAVDGHATTGSLGFSIGLSSKRASLLPPPGTPLPTQVLPSPLELLVRWINYLSLGILVGGIFFAILIWRPAFRAEGDHQRAVDAWFFRWLRPLIRWGLAGTALGVLSLLFLQAAQSSAIFAPFGIQLLELLDPHHSIIIWIRLLILLLITFLVKVLPLPGEGAARPWWEVGFLGVALLFSYSVSGHNAALGFALPLVTDGLHITAMTLWLGGLFVLALLLLRYWRGNQPAGAPRAGLILNYFSRLALSCVVVLALTGFYEALLQIRTVDALVSTRYGQAVILKTVSFALLIGFGALNMLVLIPAVKKENRRALWWISRTVRGELALGALVLAAAAMLLSISPAYGALSAQSQIGIFESWSAQDAQVQLGVAPGIVGDNEIGADITDRRPGADQLQPVVLFRFRSLEQDTGTTQVQASAGNGTRYTARGSYFPSAGRWQVQVILRRQNFDDIDHTFVVNMKSEMEDMPGMETPYNPEP